MSQSNTVFLCMIDDTSKALDELARQKTIVLHDKWECEFCGRLNKAERDTCGGCGAPQMVRKSRATKTIEPMPKPLEYPLEFCE